MEVIFKNRPHSNIEINESEENNSLDIVMKVNPEEVDFIPFLRISKKSIKALAENLEPNLDARNGHQFETDYDRVEIDNTGDDFVGPRSIGIHSYHKQPDGSIKETGISIPEEAGPYLVKALKRWAENPNL